LNEKKEIYIGTSGFQYKHWKGKFYPEDIPQKRWFEYYQRYFNTVELNTTFYHLPKESTVKSWNERTSKDFIFALKASRYITHVKRLKDPVEPVRNFYNAVGPVRDKTGAVLFQMPASAKKNMERLENFVTVLSRYKGLKALELRNPAWWDDEVFELLKQKNIAFCWYSMPGEIPPEEITADFLYIRMHGAGKLYQSRYPDSELEKLAKKIYKINIKKIFVYFNNDAGAFAVENAKKLKEVTA